MEEIFAQKKKKNEQQNPSSLLEKASASATGDWFLHRRILFRPARNQTNFLGPKAFDLEPLNPQSNPQMTVNPINEVHKSVNVEPESKGRQEEPLDSLVGDNVFKISRIGAGLENLGNTCFLNSVLQCLTYTQPLAAFVQSGRHKTTCRAAGFCAMCAIQDHVKSALVSYRQTLAPTVIVRNLRCISRTFRAGRQEDAHECFLYLMDALHKCTLPAGLSPNSPAAFEKGLLYKIFGGCLRSQVKCTKCSHCTDTFDPFLDLSLEINQADSLVKALSHFTAVEQLDDGDKRYHCEKCKVKVKALKNLQIVKAPTILAVHLKRFSSQGPIGKINKKVDFSPVLDLKPFSSSSKECLLKYTLYGVLVHAGWSTHSGHYYCFVRTSTGHWHKLDDSRVSQVSESTVLDQQAYMLFYISDLHSTKTPGTGQSDSAQINSDFILPSVMKSSSDQASPVSPSLPKEKDSLLHKKSHSHNVCKRNRSGLNSSDAQQTGDGSCDSGEITVAQHRAQSSNVFISNGGGCHGNGEKRSQYEAHKKIALQPNMGNSNHCKANESGKDSDQVFEQRNEDYCRKSNSLKGSRNIKTRKYSRHALVSPSWPVTHKLHILGVLKRVMKKESSKKVLLHHLKNKKINSKVVGRVPTEDYNADSKPVSSALPSGFDNGNFLQTNSSSKFLGMDNGGHHEVAICHDNQGQPSRVSDKTLPTLLQTRKSDALSPVLTLHKDNSAHNQTLVEGQIQTNHREDHIQRVCDAPTLKSKLYGSKVHHWDGIDSSNATSESLWDNTHSHIGHVLDEWDEEYDRGKQKKVKPFKYDQIYRDGNVNSNPFQKLANEKSKLQR